MNSALSALSQSACLVSLPVPRGLCWFSGTYEDFPGFSENFYFAVRSTFSPQVTAIANSSRESSGYDSENSSSVSTRVAFSGYSVLQPQFPSASQKLTSIVSLSGALIVTLLYRSFSLCTANLEFL
ncbi:MAG TPA: hypothetical protein VF773_20455 [Verrucomicrobiae bacterium]